MSERNLKDTLDFFVAQFSGRNCVAVEQSEDSWCFRFGEETPLLQVSCPWRIRDENCVKVGNSDQQQRFASPAPLDVREEALVLLSERKVLTVTIAPVITDATIEFEGNLWLDIFNGSASYEDWTGRATDGTRLVYLVAMGGGEIAIWDDPVAPLSRK